MFGMVTNYFVWGLDLEKPVPYEVKVKCQKYSRPLTRIFIFAVGFMWMKSEDVEFDYTEYLGKDYDKRERPCTLVSNHSSWVDIIVFLHCKYFPSFVSKDAIKNVPLIKTIGKMLNCLLIDREASKENKNKIVDDIIQRQHNIENGKDKYSLIIYPEGTTSNGFGLMKFKRGAFMSGLPIKPI